jgi:hypothetical protein
MKKIIVLIVLVLFCFTLQAKTTIYLKLDKVMKSPSTKELKPESSEKFSDETLAIVWKANPEGFQFEITNLGKSALTILWDECSFINEDKKSSKVAHGDIVRQSDIPAAAKYADIVAPINYIFWSGKSWTINPIFIEKLNDQQFAAIANKDLIYKVTLTFKQGVKKTIYNFIFKAFAHR